MLVIPDSLFMQPGFKDNLRRHGIEIMGPFQPFFCLISRQPLIGPEYLQLITAFELPGKFLGVVRDGLPAVIHIHRQANYEGFRLPLPNYGRYLVPIGLSVSDCDGFQWSSRSGKGLPDRDPYSFFSVIKTNIRVDVHACPMSVDILSRCTPSNSAETSQRFSQGVLNIMLESTGPFSQALSMISCSSCPAPQPANPNAMNDCSGPFPSAIDCNISREVVTPISSLTMIDDFHRSCG